MKRILISHTLFTAQVDASDRGWKPTSRDKAIDNEGVEVLLLSSSRCIEQFIRGHKCVEIYWGHGAMLRLSNEDWDLINHYRKIGRVKFLEF